jgi:hypothetical protein
VTATLGPVKDFSEVLSFFAYFLSFLEWAELQGLTKRGAAPEQGQW